MPTAARLFAAVVFTLVGFLAAEVYKPGMPEGTQFGLFSPIVAAIGLFCGWTVAGVLVGGSYGAAAGHGIRTSATIVFWALLLFSVYEMIQRSMKMRYDGPMEALVGVFRLMLDYGALLGSVPVIVVLGVGGVLGGWAAEFAARRWR
jgi:hypothetical protein